MILTALDQALLLLLLFYFILKKLANESSYDDGSCVHVGFLHPLALTFSHLTWFAFLFPSWRVALNLYGGKRGDSGHK